jgi:CRISPR/Cas system CSM-associated protein Csm4 (group 5 of RAMP superfamily)
MSRLGWLEDWLDATARTGAPAVSFSSCFPYLDDLVFVVPPRTVWPPATPSTKAAKVRWKSARFVPLVVVQSILAGLRLDENQWSVDGPSDCLVPAGKPGPFRTAVRSNAGVDRLTGASERHSTACIEFRAGSGLWTVVSFADESAQERWSGKVKGAFRLLADTGFGGERSRGWGRSETPEFTEGMLPDLILPFPNENAGEEPAEGAEAAVKAPTPVAPLAMVPSRDRQRAVPEAAESPSEVSASAVESAPAAVPERPAVEAPPVTAAAEAPAVETAAATHYEPPTAETPTAAASETPAAVTAPTTEPEPAAAQTTAMEAPEAEALEATAAEAPAVETAAATESQPLAAEATPIATTSETPAVETVAAVESETPAGETAPIAVPETEALETLGVETPAGEGASATEPEPPAAETTPIAVPEAEALEATASGTPAAETAPATDSEPPVQTAPIAVPEAATTPEAPAVESAQLVEPTPPESPATETAATAVAGAPAHPHWLLSLFTPAPADSVDWRRGNYTVLPRGGRIDSPTGSGELKKQIQMVAEGSVLYAETAPRGSAADVAPDGFAHPVFRAGFAVAIPLPEVR